MKVDITKREELHTLLNQLQQNTKAQWGLMTPQHMIEHLAATLQYSNGKKQIAQRSTDEEAQQAKAGFIYTDMEMARGIKSPLLGEVPGPLDFGSLDEAKMQLNKELDDFEQYFTSHPEATFVQPRLGKLNRQEWTIFHNKHFTHHFKQFGLL